LNDFNYSEHYKIDAEAFDYFEQRKGATAHDERRVHEFITSLLQPTSETILDVGCGSAWVAEKYLSKGKKVISLDISVKNPQKAITKFPDKKHFAITADSYKLPFQSNSVGSVIASEIIEHVIDPKAFVNELLRVVEPSGYLVITTPYKELLKYSLCIHCNKPTPVNAHIHSFDENKLLNLFSPTQQNALRWKTFGNKVLIFLRTYKVLQLLPFSIWKLLDGLFNLIYNAPAHIIIIVKKEA